MPSLVSKPDKYESSVIAEYQFPILSKIQARKAAALAQSYAPDDPAVQARLEKEAKDEEESIRKTCQQLGLDIHEVAFSLFPCTPVI